MADHLAIVDGRTLQAILAGEKTIESRLSKIRCLPYRRVARGDRVYFKEAGGMIGAVACVAKVLFVQDLSPESIVQLAQTHEKQLCWPKGWLEAHLAARYGSLIWLDEVGSCGPLRYKQAGRAGWLILPGPLDAANTQVGS